MIFADVTFSTEGLAIVTALLGVLCGVVAMLFKMVINSYETRLATSKEDRDSWKKIADDAGAALEVSVNRNRTLTGQPPFVALASVAPEHSSPVREHQQASADLETAKARLVALKLDLEGSGQDTRQQGTETHE